MCAVLQNEKKMPTPANNTSTGSDEKMTAAEEDVVMQPQWKVGDRVFAVWGGNGCHYAATLQEVDHDKKMVKVEWDDKDGSHLQIPFDQIMEPLEETKAWARKKIDKRVTVRDSPDKGRCLFTNEPSEPGQVVFVEKPILVTLPALHPQLWEQLQKLHELQPLNLGTITFHFAALVSLLTLDEESISIIEDKFVPDPNEEAGEDVVRILRHIKDNMKGVLDLKPHQADAKKVQRLVSSWRFNSFGHHKEDGLVLYNRISMCAHSCDPTCCWSYGDEDAFVLRSRIALKKDSELTISYLQDEDLLKSTAVRQAKLQNWRFTCMCERCKLPVDVGRGFKCRRCRVGILYASSAGSKTLEPCHVCTAPPLPEDQNMLLQLEEEYVARVDTLDKNDVADVEAVYQAAIDIFERHWILYIMDTMLWEARREKSLADAVEHQRRRIEFHEHYYCRPTFILAWCHEELGDSLHSLHPTRKWHACQEFTRAYMMLVVLCGNNHQYTASPYNKLWQINNSAANNPAANSLAANNTAVTKA
eukprot:TRINITY_DN30889_c0_g1_i1.p1 TRINITY_DN30889_c0_g1~~TRINITY_DN30889_c0_g1_i1.p1  ORF type:complete len:531 (-),score=107.33 TRINITY_DN30889_c0_g1_i1:101-1693(-)